MLKKALVLSWLLVFSSLFAETPSGVATNIPRWIGDYGALTAKLDWDDFEPYYGSAILYKVDGSRLFYVTNAHVIPDRIKLAHRLFLTTYLNGFKK